MLLTYLKIQGVLEKFEVHKDHIFPRACCYSKPESWDVLTGNSSEISNKVEEEFKTLVANGKILVPAENPVKIIKEVFSNAMSKIVTMKIDLY